MEQDLVHLRHTHIWYPLQIPLKIFALSREIMKYKMSYLLTVCKYAWWEIQISCPTKKLNEIYAQTTSIYLIYQSHQYNECDI